MSPRIEEVLELWFGECSDPRRATERNNLWFGSDPAFDDEIRRHFRPLVERAAAGELDNWRVSPRGSLALILLLDQFPRNMYRRTARAFATDAAALAICKRGLERDFLPLLQPAEQVFFLLPLSHSEQRPDQERCVECFTALLDCCATEWRPHLAHAAEFAHRHREVIRRFGRFPHRNRILGRISTAAEKAYLDGGGESWGQ